MFVSEKFVWEGGVRAIKTGCSFGKRNLPTVDFVKYKAKKSFFTKFSRNIPSIPLLPPSLLGPGLLAVCRGMIITPMSILVNLFRVQLENQHSANYDVCSTSKYGH